MRVIDAEPIIEELYKIGNEKDESGEHEFALGIDTVIYLLEQAKTVDAEPVLYCKDCKYWIDEDGIREKDGVRYARCNVHNHYIDGNHYGWCPSENDFCSYGRTERGVENDSEGSDRGY